MHDNYVCNLASVGALARYHACKDTLAGMAPEHDALANVALLAVRVQQRDAIVTGVVLGVIYFPGTSGGDEEESTPRIQMADCSWTRQRALHQRPITNTTDAKFGTGHECVHVLPPVHLW